MSTPAGIQTHAATSSASAATGAVTKERLIAVSIATALVVGLTLVLVNLANGTPAGTLNGRDYQQDACRFVPAARSLVRVWGFEPLSGGEMATESVRELGSTPAVIYVLDKSQRCVVEYGLQGGP